MMEDDTNLRQASICGAQDKQSGREVMKTQRCFGDIANPSRTSDTYLSSDTHDTQNRQHNPIIHMWGICLCVMYCFALSLLLLLLLLLLLSFDVFVLSLISSDQSYWKLGRRGVLTLCAALRAQCITALLFTGGWYICLLRSGAGARRVVAPDWLPARRRYGGWSTDIDPRPSASLDVIRKLNPAHILSWRPRGSQPREQQ